MPTFTQQQIQTAFDEATRKRFAHFNNLSWLPPWEKENEKPVLVANVDSVPDFKYTPRLQYDEIVEPRIEQLRTAHPEQMEHFLKGGRIAEDRNTAESGPVLQQVPHPDRDVSHIDPGVFTGAQPDQLRNAVQQIRKITKDLARNDGEAGKAFRAALIHLGKTEELLDPKAKGMQRLKLIFEWTLCHVTAIFGEINDALSLPDLKQGMAAYTRARDEYIAFLTDLDDAEPETKGDDYPASALRGYGRAVKWVYFLPLLHQDSKTHLVRIKGVKVVAKWNPHISSSGIPIPHE